MEGGREGGSLCVFHHHNTANNAIMSQSVLWRDTG